MQSFDLCRYINELMDAGQNIEARHQLIKLLDYHEKNALPYSPLLNHLIRRAGLYPYIRTETASWGDRFVHEAFKTDVGRGIVKTLHREQSRVLKKIINGGSIAISAPTSFGKSFIIDAFIALNKPDTVVIIVPTIALMDEIRRRIYKKFSDVYKVITTTECSLAEKNIFIFPQERALHYADSIKSIDLLIIDEFYKASFNFDKERAPSLIRAMMKLGDKAKQKYFLAPNIKELIDNPFTAGMEFVETLGFNTVYLNKREIFRDLKSDADKEKALLNILNSSDGKSLIYAGTYGEIDKVSALINRSLPEVNSNLISSFSEWLSISYASDWDLPKLIKRGVGIHNGRLHRSLSQIQIKLFDEKDGLNSIVSTSSIIEGVNTSAQNVILWKNKDGSSRLTEFSYKNVIGRSGRMFRHFVGDVFILDQPPKEAETMLEIPVPDKLLMDVDENKYRHALSEEHLNRIIAYRIEMREIVGAVYDRLVKENAFQSSDSELIKTIALDMKQNAREWNGLSFLNSDDPSSWDRLLYKVIRMKKSGWDAKYGQVVAFVQALPDNWNKSIPEMLATLKEHEIGIDDYFKLEKKVTFTLAALMADINVLQSVLLNQRVDISPFVSKLSHAFLPSVVFQLEEYGLPRMISKKLQNAAIFNFEDQSLNIHGAISMLLQMKKLVLSLPDFSTFEKYIIEYFYDGITLDKTEYQQSN